MAPRAGAAYPRLMEPGFIGGVRLKNRVVMTPMGMFGVPAPDGGLTAAGIDFYLERAKGGTALIFPAAALVTTEFESPCSALNAFDSTDRAVEWSRLAEQVHHHGARLGMQLSAGLGRATFNYFFDPSHEPVSASAAPAHWTPWLACRPLEKEEIRRIVEAFTASAGMAAGCGIDVIEIHGYGGYLLDQFMSELWNRRDDEYGGDLYNRMRFSLEVLAAVKSACGGVPVVFKMTPVHGVEGGRELEEGIEIAGMLEAAGADALHVDAGCYEAWHLAIPPVYEPPGSQVEMAAAVKEAVGIPVMANGKLGVPEFAEAVLEAGKADFIGLGRPHLADPEWARKVEEGRPEEIAPCIGCNEGCIARGFSGRYASCAVNPSCAMEGRFPLEPADRPGKLLVIGGGPAGVTAAVTAARRGMKVKLWEASPRVGGNLVAASAPPFKEDVRRLLDYMTRQLDGTGVEVSLGRSAGTGEATAENPDAVVVAVGAKPVLPCVPGAERAVQATEVLSGKLPEGHTAIVAGGGVVGCETALLLAGAGMEVTVIDAEGILVSEPVFMLNRASLMALLEESGVRMLSPAGLAGVTDAGAVVRAQGVETLIEADCVVLALGFEACGRLEEELMERGGLEVRVIGDALSPRKVLDAVWEGFHAARLL